MSDEPQTIRAIHWRELFPFLNLFRAFRVAVHPSKLVLGLAALLTIYVGGRVLDGLWPAASSPIRGEAELYEAFSAAARPGESFADGVEQLRADREGKYAARLLTAKLVKDDKEAGEAAHKAAYAGELNALVMKDRDEAIAAALKARQEQDKKIDEDKALDDAKRVRRHADTKAEYEQSVTAAFRGAHRGVAELRRLRPRGVFAEFFDYEVAQVNHVVYGVRANNWSGGVAAAADREQQARRIAENREDTADPSTGAVGVYPAVVNFFTVGPAWLFRHHLLYAILFSLLFLLAWAVFGGAIARIAAVHVARDEKISVREALRFSTSKVLSFIFAPVIPLLIVLGIGAALAAGGLLFYVPVAGPILAGFGLILALLGGLVITLVLFGTVGGMNLMYPTIAVEGSDSFDAISRSFSYVFARPWRMLFYTAVAVAYGAITYLFVKFFLYVLLASTRFFVSWWLAGQPGRWFPEMWPAPTFATLPYDIEFAGLAWSEKVAAFVISCWVYLAISFLGAFAISFYFSASTIIYSLMRREVDATELGDVYVEEEEDEFADAGPVVVAPATGTADTAPSAVPATPAVGATSAPGGGVSGTAGSGAPPSDPSPQPPTEGTAPAGM